MNNTDTLSQDVLNLLVYLCSAQLFNMQYRSSITFQVFFQRTKNQLKSMIMFEHDQMIDS